MALPKRELDAYMKRWGTPRSPERLRRIAWHIAWLVHSRQAARGMRWAVADWRLDLAWLKESYYRR